ncbi:pro-epidermal growth factor-like isoform X1 [Macrobrachium rosenbergii]|uniref:pro-epidermal growth factor-like isoform X1 n=1 Tax=Macrobrachium rosenbergii TaxID=79674 RepID=UPI0034D5468A
MSSVQIILSVMICWSSATAQTMDNHLIQLVMRTIDIVYNSSLKIDDIHARLTEMENRVAPCQQCAKKELLEDFQNTSVTVFREISSAIDALVTKDHLQELKGILNTDECEDGTHNCSEKAMCYNLPIDYTCTCLPGYSGDGFTCVDIDECQTHLNGLCKGNETCVNTIGSYECTCSEGFSKVGDSCQDIDECREGTDRCHRRAICQNTVGGYSCHCRPPYSGNGFTCNGLTCSKPSLLTEKHGCITLNSTPMNWLSANDYCKRKGMRLMEDIERQDMLALRDHFKEAMSSVTQAWVGFTGKIWMTSKTPVPENLLAVNEGALDSGCGFLDIRPGDSFGLWDYPCTGYEFYSFCQSL